ncbi:MAG: hypothetical protein ACAI44_31355 [Candidatus Sericytochromatia bacterium]
MPPLLKSGALIQPPYFAFMQQAVQILQVHELHVLQLEPAFHDQFACSGCGLCCQRPWLIAITREYFETWYQEFDSHPSGQYRQPFLLRSQPDERSFADIRRKPGTGECIFLMDDRRCFIQANYGEEALSHTCGSFPRYEGWFGSFLGRFMLTNCPEVQDLAQQFPEIRYHISSLNPDKFQAFGLKTHPLGMLQGYLWLGLQLDLIHDSRLTPIQTLRCLNAAMRESLDPQPSETPPATLEAMHQRLRRQTHEAPVAPPPGIRAEGFEAMIWLLEDFESLRTFLGEVRSGLRALPVLNPEERVLLGDFLRNYLAYRFLTMNFFSPQRVQIFYQVYFMLAAQLCQLQWLALYYREREGTALSREQLLRAATVIGYRYVHAPELIGLLSGLGTAAFLKGIDQVLSFDFCEAP